MFDFLKVNDLFLSDGGVLLYMPTCSFEHLKTSSDLLLKILVVGQGDKFAATVNLHLVRHQNLVHP